VYGNSTKTVEELQAVGDGQIEVKLWTSEDGLEFRQRLGGDNELGLRHRLPDSLSNCRVAE